MEDRVRKLNESLEGRYEIERRLGEGGMSTVYLARDVRHDRPVAIKVLLPDLAASVGPERFNREISIASRLQHPHILPLFDSGSANGLLYYTMPFVDGESLRDRLERERTVSLEESVRIATQVASALSHAHRQGFVHRDVKPGNILLSAGHAVVADFGIARAVEAAGGEALTGTGFLVGTPAYMSPEQAMADHGVDARADVYALGCVLYEMVSGAPPFTGRAQAVIAGHLASRPRSLRSAAPGVPLFFDRAVARALAKDRDERFESPDALADALRSGTVVDPVGKRRVAVLPPVDRSGTGDQDGLTLGLHEALITHLGAADLAVLGRTSVLPYRNSEVATAEIARTLEVDAVIECSLLRTAGEVEVEARLVEGHSEESLWAGTYEGSVTGLADLGRAIAGAIAEEITDAMRPAEPAPSRRTGLSPTAYQNYMRGRVHQERFTPEDFEHALRYYNAVIETHPDHAPSHAGIALLMGSKIVLGLVPALEAGPAWKAAALRAVELDPQLSEAHQALAQAYTWYDWDWPEAESAFERAIELDPNDVQARIFYAHFLGGQRRHAESLAHARRAVEIDPFNPFLQIMYSLTLLFARRLEEAKAQLETSLELAPGNALAQLGLAYYGLLSGRPAEARDAMAAYCSAVGDAEVAALLQPDGPEDSAEDAFRRGARRLAERAGQVFVKPMYVAWLYDWSGDTENAVRWIERAREFRDHEIAYLAVNGFTPRVHGHPRYRALLAELDIPAPAPASASASDPQAQLDEAR